VRGITVAAGFPTGGSLRWTRRGTAHLGALLEWLPAPSSQARDADGDGYEETDDHDTEHPEPRADDEVESPGRGGCRVVEVPAETPETDDPTPDQNRHPATQGLLPFLFRGKRRSPAGHSQGDETDGGLQETVTGLPEPRPREIVAKPTDQLIEVGVLRHSRKDTSRPVGNGTYGLLRSDSDDGSRALKAPARCCSGSASWDRVRRNMDDRPGLAGCVSRVDGSSRGPLKPGGEGLAARQKAML
jgi:hypothetical protein